jgi:hypothetical protein
MVPEMRKTIKRLEARVAEMEKRMEGKYKEERDA